MIHVGNEGADTSRSHSQSLPKGREKMRSIPYECDPSFRVKGKLPEDPGGQKLDMERPEGEARGPSQQPPIGRSRQPSHSIQLSPLYKNHS